ncbi:hypothetical protein [Leptolyngbya sp. FACHB-16]|uniref:hypothetical protein n=1 Tax=unclassified Leptolyngbya TaxID=2650499 RepID=UPI0016835FB3|nr:hypothetical protein [Leptolyngbya sp. FACHB-16]MBD2156409.1 hypothetical protein [Leptolyngbya sp. FACHB-16]
MSSHFSPKSLAFYGVAIGSVTVLFLATTRYGQAHLQAPKAIEGDYAIAPGTLPGCLGDRPLTLSIQQSGIYLTGTLLANDADDRTVRIAKERPSLTGRWNSQELTLSGSLSHIPQCSGTVEIQGAIQNNTLTGTAQLDALMPPIPFTAQWQEAPDATEGEAH